MPDDDAEERDASGERIRDRLPHERGAGAAVLGRRSRRLAVRVARLAAAAPPATARRRRWRRAAAACRCWSSPRCSSDREDARRGDAALEPGDELVLAQRAGVEELLHQRVVGLGDHLDQRLARRVGGLDHVRRGWRRRPACRCRRSANMQAFIATRSTTPAKAFSSPIGSWIGMTVRPNDAAQRLERAVEAGALAVEPVQRDQPRHRQLVRRLPDFLGRDFDAVQRVDHDQCGVGHAQRRARVAQEVRQPRRVDEIDLGLVPLGVGDAGGQGVLAGDLFFVVVRDRRALVHLAEPVDGPRIEEEGGDELRLSGSGVADQRHVPQAGGVIDLHGGTLRFGPS